MAAMPTSPLAMMVLIIKILAIALAGMMSAPIGILSLKICPVMRISLVPRIPLRLIPVIGSDNIGRRIRIIWGPAILISEKSNRGFHLKTNHPGNRSKAYYSQPTGSSKDPGAGVDSCTRHNPERKKVRTSPRSRLRQQNYQCNNKTKPFHTYLRKLHYVCHMISGVADRPRRSPGLDPNAKVVLVRLSPKMGLSAFPRVSLATALPHQGSICLIHRSNEPKK